MAREEGRDPASLGSALYHNINVNEDRQAALAQIQGVSRRLLHGEVLAGVRGAVDGGRLLPRSARRSCARTSRPASATWRCAWRRGIRPGSSRASWARSRPRWTGKVMTSRSILLVAVAAVVRERAVVAGAGDPGLLHPRSGHRLVRLRRHHGRAAAQDAAGRLERRRQAVRRAASAIRGWSPRTRHRSACRFTVTNRWAFEGKEGLRREARQPPRPGGRARHLLSRRHRHQEARHHLAAGREGPQDSA